MANEMETKKELILKENHKIESEKDMIKRKITNFKSTIETGSNRSEKSDSKRSSIDRNKNPEIIKTKNKEDTKNKFNENNPNQVNHNDVRDNEAVLLNSKCINLIASKKFLDSDYEEQKSEEETIDKNIVNDINSDIEHNIFKYDES